MQSAAIQHSAQPPLMAAKVAASKMASGLGTSDVHHRLWKPASPKGSINHSRLQPTFCRS